MDGNDVVVYPNPSTDFVTFSTNNPLTSIASIEVIDIAGRMVFNNQTVNVSSEQVSVKNLNAAFMLVALLWTTEQN